MKRLAILLILIIPLLFAGCEQFNDIRSSLSSLSVDNNKKVVSEANWDEMKTVRVELNEFSFRPSDLSFVAGQPYKLEIVNSGSEKHYFTSEDFFRAVAARKVQSNSDGEIKADFFRALEVFPGRSLDFYFVPTKKGKYDLVCTIEGHIEKGMVGNVFVVEEE